MSVRDTISQPGKFRGRLGTELWQRIGKLVLMNFSSKAISLIYNKLNNL